MEEGETENQRERAARGELGLTSLALKREKRVEPRNVDTF